MNIGYESEELQPYIEPEADLNDEIRIRELTIPTCTCRDAIVSTTDRQYIMFGIW